jgi:predicted NBD/HSP70 family sugar kinase
MIELERIPVSSPASVTVFRKILTHGPIGRSDVARATGLSQAAVTKAVNPLIAAGYVEESAAERAGVGAGRPISPLVVVRDRAYIVGVKVTADRSYGVLTDLNAQVLATASAANASPAVDDVVTAVTEVVAELRALSPGEVLGGVGVTVSGDVDSWAGRVRDSPLMGWKAVDLRTILESRLSLPVTLENDVRALTVSEQLFGLGVDADSFAVVTIGAGIGCGIFVNGGIVEGANGVSGEIGHLPLAPENLVCTCGRRGCVETVASSRAILERIQSLVGSRPETIGEAFALAHAGDPIVIETFARAGDVIGSALAALVNLIGPELVIIAGEGVAEFDLYADHIRGRFAEHAFGAAANCEILLRSHSFDDWARGAAAVVIRGIAAGAGDNVSV